MRKACKELISALISRMMAQCKKIGEGVYGEVFRTQSEKNSVALKVSENFKGSSPKFICSK